MATYPSIDYVSPETRNSPLFAAAVANDPSLAKLAEWSAAQDATRVNPLSTLTPVSTGTIDTLSTTIPKKSGGFQPDRDLYGQVLYRNPYGTGEYIDNAVDATFNDTFRNHPYWGSYIEKGLVNISNSEKEAWINQALAEKASSTNPSTIVNNSVTPASTSAMKALDKIATTGTPDIYSEYIEPFTRQNFLNSTLTDPNRIAQLQRSASEDATKNLTAAQITAAQGQATQLAKLNTSALGAGDVNKIATTGTQGLATGDTTKISTTGTQGATTGDVNKIATTGTQGLTTGDINKLVTSPASTSSSNAMNTGSIPALTTADLASWGKSLPQGITGDQLTAALKTQQDTLNKSYTDALAGNQTALTSQNANFLKDWNTSADALKTSILSGVDTKNQQFGTQATQGFMDAFKNFQIPTNQQTGVNLGNYNDNRNAAADQWWSQYVTGRR
jgi:hypothetical protein